MKILLDYFFPIASIEPTPSASTAFLKQACLVVKKNSGGTNGAITLCTTSEQVAAITDNTEADDLFAGGLSRVYILCNPDLDLADALEGHESDFYTVIISSDFSDADVTHIDAVAAVKAYLKVQDILYTAKTAGVAGNSITIDYDIGASAGAATVVVTVNAIVVTISSTTTAATIAAAIVASGPAAALVDVAVDSGDETDIQAVTSSAPLAHGVSAVTGTEDGLQVGDFEGVVGVQSTDDTFLGLQAAIRNRAAFHTTSTNKAENMCYAFGKMLSNSLNWRNQQYITMPVADDVATLGDANALFDDKISFVISDDEFSNRLALFACGGKAIVAPYIIKNLQVDLQSSALSYISGNQPAYTKKQGALLEDELKKVVQSYIDREWIEAGTVEVKLEQDNFVASGYINVAEPKALWRVFGEMRQSL